jgi:hypothetical protein
LLISSSRTMSTSLLQLTVEHYLLKNKVDGKRIQKRRKGKRYTLQLPLPIPESPEVIVRHMDGGPESENLVGIIATAHTERVGHVTSYDTEVHGVVVKPNQE